jgi:hypothetical protein|nr:MAG TPA: hypothetical protein [Caudoviricetes sp.]
MLLLPVIWFDLREYYFNLFEVFEVIDSYSRYV